MMSNGYKPTPLDLSDIKLTPGQELLVDKLAENAHNVWAKDRIKQGWTYGIQQVRCMYSCTLCWDQNKQNLTLKSPLRCLLRQLSPRCPALLLYFFYVLSFSFMVH